MYELTRLVVHTKYCQKNIFSKSLLLYSKQLVGMMSRHPIFFVGLRVKIKRVIAILAQESKLCSGESKTSKNFICSLKTI